MQLNTSLQHYEFKLQQFIKNIPNQHYLIEMTKMCGYSEFMMVPKTNSLIDLYRQTSTQFMTDTMQQIYFSDNKQDKVPLSANITVQQFIQTKQLRCIYSLDCHVVYRFFVDDHH